MTMREQDLDEIIKGTVDHLRVRLAHRNIYPDDAAIEKVAAEVHYQLASYTDNSADTGGDWDNA